MTLRRQVEEEAEAEAAAAEAAAAEHLRDIDSDAEPKVFDVLLQT